MIDPATRTLHVEVDLENPDLLLMPGMYVKVTFEIPHKGLLRVPASALMFKSSGPQVAVVDKDGKIHFPKRPDRHRQRRLCRDRLRRLSQISRWR